MKKVTILLTVFSIFLPNSIKIRLYNRFLGHCIDKTAYIGFSFIWVRKIIMKEHSRIGHFNFITNLEMLKLGQFSSIRNFNRASALPLNSTKHFKDVLDRYPSLFLGKHTSVVNRNFFDCNSKIEIGDFSLIAGQGCIFYTHGINIENNRQETAPIKIGDYCMIGSRSILIKGSTLPSFSLLGANSTLHKKYKDSYWLYSGVPALPVKQLDTKSAFFTRKIGRVD